MRLLAANVANSVLTSVLSATALTLNVKPGDGVKFPSPVPGNSYFLITLKSQIDPNNIEIVQVTDVVDDVFTIVRAQENTTAKEWPLSTIVANVFTAGTFDLLAQVDDVINLAQLADDGGAQLVGTTSGDTVQVELTNIKDHLVTVDSEFVALQGTVDSILPALAQSTGATLVKTSRNQTVEQELTTLHMVANVRDPKFAGGAKGNWNETTKTGDDDTAAFQAAIDYLVTLPNRRNGGGRVLYVPAGMYMTKGLIVPESFNFGFNMIGAGRDATLIYCNPASPTTTPGLFIKTEFSYIDNLSMFGSDISSAIDTANYVTDLLRIQLPSGRADCDLVCGEGLQLGNALNCVTIYGRGFIFKGLGVLFTNFLNIVASSTLVWNSASVINSSTTGMRNYMINGCRFDQGGVLVTVTGDATATLLINGIRIIGNDVLGVLSVISASTATLYGLVLNSNTMYDTGNVDVVNCYGLVACIVNGNVITKKIAIETVPTVANDQLPRVIRSGRAIVGLIISNNEFGAMRDCIVSCATTSGHVRIIGNTFHQAFILAGATLFTGADCSGLIISDNNFTGGSSSIQPWSTATQTLIGVFKNNYANVKFTHPGNYFVPTINKGGTAVTATVAVCYFTYDGYYCTARYAVAGAMGGAGGTINITTPMTPLGEFPALTSTVAGGGVVHYVAGATAQLTARVLTTGVVNFYLSSGVATALAGTDVSGTLSVEFEIKFRA